jgi:hypothetical protein
MPFADTAADSGSLLAAGEAEIPALCLFLFYSAFLLLL